MQSLLTVVNTWITSSFPWRCLPHSFALTNCFPSDKRRDSLTLHFVRAKGKAQSISPTLWDPHGEVLPLWGSRCSRQIRVGIKRKNETGGRGADLCFHGNQLLPWIQVPLLHFSLKSLWGRRKSREDFHNTSFKVKNRRLFLCRGDSCTAYNSAIHLSNSEVCQIK